MSATEWVKIGGDHYEEREYENAVICFKKGMEVDPKYAEAYYGLGCCYFALEQKEKALE